MDSNNYKNRIALIKGDITKLEIATIVNATNSSLLVSSSIVGSIHKAGES